MPEPLDVSEQPRLLFASSLPPLLWLLVLILRFWVVKGWNLFEINLTIHEPYNIPHLASSSLSLFSAAFLFKSRLVIELIN